MINYEGKRVRVRTFAWDFWNPEDPLGDGKVVRVCATAGCVSRGHIQKMAPVPLTEEALARSKNMDMNWARAMVQLIKHQPNAVIENEKRLENIKRECRLYPLSFESNPEAVDERVKLIAAACTDGDEEAATLLLDDTWGVIE